MEVELIPTLLVQESDQITQIKSEVEQIASETVNQLDHVQLDRIEIQVATDHESNPSRESGQPPQQVVDIWLLVNSNQLLSQQHIQQLLSQLQTGVEYSNLVFRVNSMLYFRY